jgi:hypothetical protein
MKKKIMLISTPRSGSTPILQLIHESHKVNYPDAYCVSEIALRTFAFAPAESGPRLEWMGGEDTEDFWRAPFVTGIELAKRLEWFFKFPTPISTKVFTQSIPVQVMRFAPQSLEYVFLKRKDTWQHCLSFLLSQETRKFYASEGLHYEKKSVAIRKVSFDRFLTCTKSYIHWRSLFPHLPEVYFEDFEMKGADFILNQLGYPKVTNFKPNFPKQNLGSKEAAIANIEEVRKWFDQNIFE